jgi:hypothetical protein
MKVIIQSKEKKPNDNRRDFKREEGTQEEKKKPYLHFAQAFCGSSGLLIWVG